MNLLVLLDLWPMILQNIFLKRFRLHVVYIIKKNTRLTIVIML